MRKYYRSCEGYEIVGGSRDGNLIDLDSLGNKLEEGDAWAIWTENTVPPIPETYILKGHKLFFSGYLFK